MAMAASASRAPTAIPAIAPPDSEELESDWFKLLLELGSRVVVTVLVVTAPDNVTTWVLTVAEGVTDVLGLGVCLNVKSANTSIYVQVTPGGSESEGTYHLIDVRDRVIGIERNPNIEQQVQEPDHTAAKEVVEVVDELPAVVVWEE